MYKHIFYLTYTYFYIKHNNHYLLTNTPIFLINIETERKDCFNKVYKIIINMSWWYSKLEFSIGANSKLPQAHVSTEKMRRSKGIKIPRFPLRVTSFSVVLQIWYSLKKL